MKRTNDKTLKEAIMQYLDVRKMRRKFDETALIAAWPELMGQAIANRTTKLYIRDKRLYIGVESAVIKQELMMMRQQIIGKLNEHVGAVVVEALVIL
ncbi:DUF721 domain-containing protein [Olivibacter sitiensis]|uniref:DUF721 domain-containing protein n=1 Tax=Olivibacter sitiensis TaxID=376470 RepID=UPI00042453E1|nr:DUF721 domain-containing protein [Olivibacter sitiensis]